MFLPVFRRNYGSLTQHLNHLQLRMKAFPPLIAQSVKYEVKTWLAEGQWLCFLIKNDPGAADSVSANPGEPSFSRCNKWAFTDLPRASSVIKRWGFSFIIQKPQRKPWSLPPESRKKNKEVAIYTCHLGRDRWLLLNKPEKEKRYCVMALKSLLLIRLGHVERTF